MSPPSNYIVMFASSDSVRVGWQHLGLMRMGLAFHFWLGEV